MKDGTRSVPWRDLVALTPLEKVWEMTLSLPWLAASLIFYEMGAWPLGVAASFFFFLTGLRQSHNAQHYCLGIARVAHDVMLAFLSVLMMASMHTVQVTHLHHHRHCLDDEDVEAGHARLPWWRVLLTGPLFPLKLHVWAWRLGSRRQRAWILVELVGITVWGVVVWMLLDVPCLRWHTAAMVVGECFTGFFAVWTVHHGCEPHEVARTQRGWFKNFVSYSMFYHLEHHLYPAVPTCHLPELARRLDRAAPGTRKMVF